MSGQKPELPTCICGADAPEPQVDEPFERTWIECRRCSRVVGGKDREDARGMWWRAMRAGEPPASG